MTTWPFAWPRGLPTCPILESANSSKGSFKKKLLRRWTGIPLQCGCRYFCVSCLFFRVRVEGKGNSWQRGNTSTLTRTGIYPLQCGCRFFCVSCLFFRVRVEGKGSYSRRLALQCLTELVTCLPPLTLTRGEKKNLTIGPTTDNFSVIITFSREISTTAKPGYCLTVGAKGQILFFASG